MYSYMVNYSIQGSIFALTQQASPLLSDIFYIIPVSKRW